ncbi:conserved hypothetical protein [Trichinella spiralis]|uniref:hypothetical protein n=1 Tax=Trichinella spiralis TaxID=6334 RepID=UPI0001EFEB36|nr:conserved hypothetical protein [Trichinella spiralis]
MLVEDTSENCPSVTEVQRDNVTGRMKCWMLTVGAPIAASSQFPPAPFFCCEAELRHDSGRYHRPSSGVGKRFKTFIECDSALSFPRRAVRIDTQQSRRAVVDAMKTITS